MTTTRVYTTGEVAKFCHVRKLTVARWVDRGELAAHQLPGRGDRRITHEDLLAFMTRNNFPLPEELAENGIDVLVVEDDPPVAETIAHALSEAGFSVETADSGFRAGSLTEQHRPAIIILDMDSGADMLHSIRKQKRLNATKILVIHGETDSRIEEALAAGANDALPRSYRKQELVSAVRQLTRRPPARKG